MLYKCELINDGAIGERFFREGKSVKEIQEQLDVFQWGKGRWRITPANDDGGTADDETEE